MAYGFNFSGVGCLVYSLWKVDETETNNIMLYFYEALKTNIPKDEALHQAKIRYLKKAGPITANPRYWAGFVLNGNTSPFYFSNDFPVWIPVLIIFFVSLFVFILKKMKF